MASIAIGDGTPIADTEFALGMVFVLRIPMLFSVLHHYSN
jgi:hypothetical protein